MVSRRRKVLKPNKKRKVRQRANGICEKEKCYTEIDEKNSEIHHIIPTEFGGTDDLNNLVAICLRCHKEISQYHQRTIVWIKNHEIFLRRNQNIPFWRKQKTEEEISRLKKELLTKYRFKNKEINPIDLFL